MKTHLGASAAAQRIRGICACIARALFATCIYRHACRPRDEDDRKRLRGIGMVGGALSANPRAIHHDEVAAHKPRRLLGSDPADGRREQCRHHVQHVRGRKAAVHGPRVARSRREIGQIDDPRTRERGAHSIVRALSFRNEEIARWMLGVIVYACVCVCRYIHSGNVTEENGTGAKKVIQFDAGFSELRKLKTLCVRCWYKRRHAGTLDSCCSSFSVQGVRECEFPTTSRRPQDPRRTHRSVRVRLYEASLLCVWAAAA